MQEKQIVDYKIMSKSITTKNEIGEFEKSVKAEIINNNWEPQGGICMFLCHNYYIVQQAMVQYRYNY